MRSTHDGTWAESVISSIVGLLGICLLYRSFGAGLVFSSLSIEYVTNVLFWRRTEESSTKRRAERMDELGVPRPVTSEVQSRLSIGQRIKGFGLKRLLVACVGIGVGLGIGIIATVASIVWLTSRPTPTPEPIPARDWPQLDVEGAGLRAKLKTDWNDSVRLQLLVTPRSDDLRAAFNDAVQSHRDSISFTVHLYDKAGFELCKKDVTPTPAVGAADRIDELQANDTFLGYECSLSNYKEADDWNLSYVFPALIAKTKTATARTATPQESTPSEEDDTLTGFDSYRGHLETLSGKTFLVREGEKDIASMWNINAQVEGKKQPRLHITCKTKDDCVIENTTNSQAVHGRRIG